MSIVAMIQAMRPFVQVVSQVPWERVTRRPTLSFDYPPPATTAPPPQQEEPIEVAPATPPGQSTTEKPGCTAADEAGQVLFHLQGLAEGKPGFGVLQLDGARLDRAAQGAEGMGHPEIATKLRAFKDELGSVTDQESAQAAVASFKPTVDEAWYLGQRCGLASNSPIRYAKALAERVKAGEMSYDAAVQEMRARLPGGGHGATTAA